MVYRIRLGDGWGGGHHEAVVEATNPTEALVKFCHTCCEGDDPNEVRGHVTSISAETEELLLD